jgi:hypothetical protein
VDVDGQNRAVTAYDLGGSLWEHLTQGTKRFAATPGLRFGGKLLIIPDNLAATLNAEAKEAEAAPPPPATMVGATPDLPPATDLPSASDTGAPLPELSPLPPPVADAAPTPYPAPPPDAPTGAEDKARGDGGTL